MPVFIVAYDLKTAGKDYTNLTTAISAAPHCHAQGSVWFVEHTGPATAVRDVLLQHIDANDVLFVDQVSSAWAGAHMPTCGAWLNQRGS